MVDAGAKWVSWCATDFGVEITFPDDLVVVLSKADLELMLKAYEGHKAAIRSFG